MFLFPAPFCVKTYSGGLMEFSSKAELPRKQLLFSWRKMFITLHVHALCVSELQKQAAAVYSWEMAWNRNKITNVFGST